MRNLKADAMDVIVLGSGMAGLMAALTASDAGLQVMVLESSPFIGGTTAVSEGMAWVPLSAQALEAGVADRAEDAVDYLRETSAGRGDLALIRAYVDAAPRALAFLEARTAVRYRLNRGSLDYYPEAPGATRGARALNPGLFDARRLTRADFARLRPPLPTMMLLGGLSIASEDLPSYLSASRSPGSAMRVAGWTARYLADRAACWPRGTRIANGNGIVGALLAALTARGVLIRTEAKALALTCRNGRVAGVEIEGRDGRECVAAERGVILATGSFSHDRDLARQWVAHIADGVPHTTVVPKGAEGDGLRLAQSLGAAVVDDVLGAALWAPVSQVPGPHGPSPWPHFSDRAKPGVIIVNRSGRRFGNEAATYRDFVPMMLAQRGNQADAGAFIITDHAALRRYGLGPIGPHPMPLGRYLASGYLRRGQDLADLARHLGVDAQDLEATVTRYNGPAREGRDPEFGKGGSAYDRSNGDPSAQPAPNIRPLGPGPYYAIEILPGDLGTFVGLAIDPKARVLRGGGAPIPGLYAAGNVAANLTGGNYPAAGLTIGAAMTFGYIAGHLEGD
jgi:succinate dehydrogenase/fumarate reductase flavoprotein subunit